MYNSCTWCQFTYCSKHYEEKEGLGGIEEEDGSPARNKCDRCDGVICFNCLHVNEDYYPAFGDCSDCDEHLCVTCFSGGLSDEASVTYSCDMDCYRKYSTNGNYRELIHVPGICYNCAESRRRFG